MHVTIQPSCGRVAGADADAGVAADVTEHGRVSGAHAHTCTYVPVGEPGVAAGLAEPGGVFSDLAHNSALVLAFFCGVISESASRAVKRILGAVLVVRMQPLSALALGYAGSVTVGHSNLRVISIGASVNT